MCPVLVIIEHVAIRIRIQDWTRVRILTGLEVGPNLLYNQINYVFFAVRSQLIKTKRKENLLYKRNLLVFRCASFRIIDHRIQWFIVSYMTCKKSRTRDKKNRSFLLHLLLLRKYLVGKINVSILLNLSLEFFWVFHHPVVLDIQGYGYVRRFVSNEEV